MRKWINLILSLLFIFVVVSIFGSFNIFTPQILKGEKSGGARIALTQNAEKEEKQGETDPYTILILKKLQEKLNEWLKSLNERIENEDVTRFEVRFLEILRNILEWVKEKVDSKIESSEKEKPKKKERGLSQETHQRVSPFSEIG